VQEPDRRNIGRQSKCKSLSFSKLSLVNHAMTKAILFSSPFVRTLTVVVACLFVSVVMTAAMPVYLPFNQGDRIAGPTLLFPFVWLSLFLYSAMCRSIKRVWGVLALLLVSHSLLIIWALKGS